MPPDVLLVEPWFGGSHQAWAEGYQRHSQFDVELLTLPDEGWKWRMRGSAISLAARVQRCPDVVLASSLLDVASFLGHSRGVLDDVPIVLYMHENQLTYPLPEGASRDMGLAFINWSSMVAADQVVFNSEFHRSSWFEGLPAMLQSHPDPSHVDLIESVVEKSTVLPVGVEMGWLDDRSLDKTDPPLLLWNQRWEHDKDPDTLAWALGELLDFDIRVAICGEAPFGRVPDSLASLPELWGDRLIHFGFAERDVYEALLLDASVVVSTARHEFFGVAVVEAMAAGARPVLPNNLSYPGLVASESWEESLYRTRGELVEKLAATFGHSSSPDLTVEAARRFDWRRVAPAYDELLRGLA